MVHPVAQSSVQASLDAATSTPLSEGGVPGLVFVAVDKTGSPICAAASGKRGGVAAAPAAPAAGEAAREQMDLETVFWIASCTKLVATIACLQAVERGELELDNAAALRKVCPELGRVQVLKDGRLEDRKAEITLRMLLAHTAGFGYEFFHRELREHGRPVGYDVFSGDVEEVLRMPLVHQPGETWEYGVNIDWAGIALERSTGVKLNDWIQKNIMQPLGVSSATMFPTAEMKKNLACMHQRWPGSKACEERDHIYRAPLVAESDAQRERIFHSGGAGMFAKPIEYVQVLAALLNDGASPTSGARILRPETVAAMFENQIPRHPDFARKGVPAAKPEHTNPIPELYPQPGNPPQGWGLSFMITQEPGVTGRGRNTAWWAGIANLYWWCDREKGVAGMIASQVMPFADLAVMGQWATCEAAVYQALGK